MSKTFTKQQLIAELLDIINAGPTNAMAMDSQTGKMAVVPAAAKKDGAVGDTLEHLLGIETNNLPIPNAGEWELKAQQVTMRKSMSLVTLKHVEPSPTACRVVPRVMLPIYGWPHQAAGSKYPADERSFRLTISTKTTNARGFTLNIDDIDRKLVVAYDATRVTREHTDWKNGVSAALAKITPRDCPAVIPYWGLKDLYAQLRAKLTNCFYVVAKKSTKDGRIQFHYTEFYILEDFSIAKFEDAIRCGKIFVDFDARTGHNHGTKIRLAPADLPSLYERVTRY